MTKRGFCPLLVNGPSYDHKSTMHVHESTNAIPSREPSCICDKKIVRLLPKCNQGHFLRNWGWSKIMIWFGRSEGLRHLLHCKASDRSHPASR
jgi:hypothetical protein